MDLNLHLHLIPIEMEFESLIWATASWAVVLWPTWLTVNFEQNNFLPFKRLKWSQ